MNAHLCKNICIYMAVSRFLKTNSHCRTIVDRALKIPAPDYKAHMPAV